MVTRAPRGSRARSVVTTALVLGLLPGTEGCRACGPSDEPDASAQPAMPKGMLAPAASGAAASEAKVLLTPGKEGDSDQGAPPPADAHPRGEHETSLSLVVLLHEPLARAKPGFDLLRPHYFDAEALRRLESELVAFLAEWQKLSSYAEARRVLGESDGLRQLEASGQAFPEARAGIARMIDSVLADCRRAAFQRTGLWVRAA